jgi:hypothetical protein
MNREAALVAAVQVVGQMLTMRSDCACSPGVHRMQGDEWPGPEGLPQRESPARSHPNTGGGSGLSGQVSVMSHAGLDFSQFPHLIAFCLP